MIVSLPRRPSCRTRRKTTLIGSTLSVLLIVVIYYCHGWTSRFDPTAVAANNVAAGHKAQAQFWRTLYHIILNNDPRCKKLPDKAIPQKLDIAYEDDHLHERPDILWIDDADLQRLKITHQNFLHDIGSSHLKLVYQPGTRGVITTVAETALPILLIQLRMLRSAGSSLPVEVFLSQATPSSTHICTTILPTLNATCIYYSDIFTAAGTGVDFTSYQYKILAILFSSFDEILLLDADAWPISNPDHLFTYPPFTDTGLVIWPDFWYASESPYFFTIAKIDNPPLLHMRPSSESGELMYAKSKHESSIMLAAYYNYFGPNYYYPLQSQGAPGQGDKETFGLAALALKEEFYWVRTMVTALGRVDSSGHFLGSAMVQYDPIVDFQHKDSVSQSKVLTSKEHDAQLENPKGTPKLAIPPKRTNKPMFIHANFPKFDPRTIFNNNDIGGGIFASPARDSNGSFVRCWDIPAQAAVQRFGYDVERRFWEVIKTVACKDLVGQGDESKKFKEIQICTLVEAYVNTVFNWADPKG